MQHLYTDPQPTIHQEWIRTCPECLPPKTMQISAIIPQVLGPSSTATFLCERCLYFEAIVLVLR